MPSSSKERLLVKVPGLQKSVQGPQRWEGEVVRRAPATCSDAHSKSSGPRRHPPPHQDG